MILTSQKDDKDTWMCQLTFLGLWVRLHDPFKQSVEADPDEDPADHGHVVQHVMVVDVER